MRVCVLCLSLLAPLVRARNKQARPIVNPQQFATYRTTVISRAIDADERNSELQPASDYSSDPDNNNEQILPTTTQASDDDDDDCDSNENEETVVVGVKSHSVKSNAVGDGDGSDNDDSDSDNDAWQLQPQVQVQMQVVNTTAENESNKEEATLDISSVRLDKNDSQQHQLNNNNHDDAFLKQRDEAFQQAWLPYVYLPPSRAAHEYLTKHARAVDNASKTRLDRRTLYACALLTSLNQNIRKCVDADVSQQLQAALSMASQPQWRRSKGEGVKLYSGDSEHTTGTTLAMQETIALALAHSLGAAMVILDDDTLLSIRKQLLGDGFSEEEIKPTYLLRALFSLMTNAKTKPCGLISTCMQRDLDTGLDDPYDERATSSCQEMEVWEKTWFEKDGKTKTDAVSPLVVFLRVDSCKNLLKSKSANEIILQECNSKESINMVVLGKGIDVKTTTLPQELTHDFESQDMSQSSTNNAAAPWFGFSPHNQNASGQNDPVGSRRFNIFLARTVDPNGTPGILVAIAPPQAGNLFPNMMAMQAQNRMKQTESEQDDDFPMKSEFEKWAQVIEQQMQSNGLVPPPIFQISKKFCNVSLPFDSGSENNNAEPPTPEVIQQTLQNAMSKLLDDLAQLNDDTEGPPGFPINLSKAFAQILQNENLRKGIAENLARAAPALSDPKCQGVMLSIYVPPPSNRIVQGTLPEASGKNPLNMGSWFQKVLDSQEEQAEGLDEEGLENNRKKRVRTMAAAAAVMAAKDAQTAKDKKQGDSKADRNLARLETLCRPIVVNTPSDPVRAKSWESWIARERGAVIFRQNRRALNEQLEAYNLALQEHVGTTGAGSSLRQMLSVRDISDEMEDVIKCSVELEASKSQRQHESAQEMHTREANLGVDITLSQLLEKDDVLFENTYTRSASKSRNDNVNVKYLHPSSLEKALLMVCRISPSPSGGQSVTGTPIAHRTKDEITALAQDKHERALVSQVVSPQDIGVTYDMIGGLNEVKDLLRQSITYPLKFPHLYSEGIAREAVKGVLLFGPPGTGKTMLAKAVATEGGATFLSVDASSVENKWLGESEKNAKAVFTLARRLAPCVIFIDEVDSLLSSREGSSDDSAHGTLTSVKTTMMSEWDGLNSGTNGFGEAGSDRVVVIGSTNRPFDLDEAVLRRFPRRILVDLPDLTTRTEILEVTLAENRLDPAVNLTKIAERLEGFTGSDIKEVCREAVVQISHEQAKLLDQGFVGLTREDVTLGSLQRLRAVTKEDFEKALSKLKRSVSETGKELARVWEWNDEYGEIKKDSKSRLGRLANMYL